ncbi:phage tail sheath family protein [Mycolicibacterium mageritense]|uniref:phage tail sheath family protein n=1 Tax=Mycolicibacterium mageritense TaxID=53462 RepID=UPI001E4944D2|nr:phage tail sheath subtilisin-like domain-containing protein [Mycolicibacterium mageritense]GJJ17356.1 hypothetical protein MTY414_10290 [Mycolicibacterium mageritense]
MAERLTPGVYVEEIPGGVRPIQGVGTSTAAFVGQAQRGIPDRAVFVNGFGDFTRKFGGHSRGEAGFLAQAVDAFFAAGGRRAYVVRVLPGNAADPAVSPALQARADDAWGVRHNVLRFTAKGQGAWADHVRIHIENSTSFAGETFRLRLEWVEAGRSRTIETYDGVRMDPESEDYAVRVVNETSQYVRADDLFQIEFVDAEERSTPPIPGRAPVLEARPGADGNYSVPEQARLTFAWDDLSSTTPNQSSVAVEFSSEAIEAAGGTVTGAVGLLTPDQLQDLLATALGDTFTVDVANARVRVTPAVALGTVLAAETPDGSDQFDVDPLTGVTLTVTDSAGATDIVVDTTADTTLSPQALADRINAELPATNPHGVVADGAGRFLVVTADGAPEGVTLALAATGGAAPWGAPVTSGGTGGAAVGSLANVQVRVAEQLRPGVPRVLSRLFPVVRATGLERNSAANPDLRPALTEDSPVRLLGGDDGSGAVLPDRFAGTVTADGRTGLHALDSVNVNILCLPGRTTADYLAPAMTFCERNDVFFIADGVGSIDPDFQVTADEVRQAVEGLPTVSENAALFYPWVEVTDPVGIGRNPRRMVPPSGHMAGIFARTDVTRGVWKAPAGIDSIVNGAVDVQHRLIDADQDLLNPIGVNCIRQFPGIGIVNWGARTLAADPEWRYINVRRMGLFLKASIKRGLYWAVFEPNDQELWDRIRININAFMLGLFRQRAFQGATPDEAFVVKCDRETNPQELVDQGIVTAQVAWAPLKPAEFVVIEISQKSLLAV